MANLWSVFYSVYMFLCVKIKRFENKKVDSIFWNLYVNSLCLHNGSFNSGATGLHLALFFLLFTRMILFKILEHVGFSFNFYFFDNKSMNI